MTATPEIVRPACGKDPNDNWRPVRGKLCPARASPFARVYTREDARGTHVYWTVPRRSILCMQPSMLAYGGHTVECGSSRSGPVPGRLRGARRRERRAVHRRLLGSLLFSVSASSSSPNGLKRRVRALRRALNVQRACTP